MRTEPPSDLRWPLGIFAAGLALFGSSWSGHVTPGLSAEALAGHLRLTPFPPLDHPLWCWLARAVASVAGAATPAVMNAVSILCAAASLALLFMLVRTAVRDERMHRHLPLAAALSGAAAAGYLAAATPFWLAANRAHPAAFDTCWLLASLWLIARFGRSGRLPLLYAGMALYGAGMAEVATLLAAAPVVCLYALYLLLRRGHWSFRAAAGMAACLLTWPAIVALAAWDYARLPVAEWRGFSGLGEVAWYFLLEQRAALLSSVPRQGWLLLGVGTLVPWLLSLMTLRRAFDGEVGWASLALYAVITALVVAVLFGAPFAPWRVLGTAPLVVTPYVLLAATFGFMVARWCGVAVQWAGERAPRWPVAWMVAGLGIATTVAAGVRHRDAVSTRAGADTEAIARVMLDQLSGRTVCFTDGLLDAPLRIEAWRRGASVVWIDVTKAELQSYRRYVAAKVDEERLQALALAGLAPMLSEWLRSDPRAGERLAMAIGPDPWLREGFTPLPEGSVYLATRDPASMDAETLAARNRDFRADLLPRLARLRAAPPPAPAEADGLAHRASRIANDCGVALEHAGRPDLAREAYVGALALRGTNLSAIANLLALGGDVGERERLEAFAAGAARDGAPGLAACIAEYGHIRRAEGAAFLGATSRVAQTDAPADPPFEAVMKLYLDGERDEARRRMDRLLAEHSDRDAYWLLLAAMGYEAGDSDVLQRCLDQMRAVGREWPSLLVLLGRQAWDQGDAATAQRYLERAAFLRGGDPALQEILLQLDLKAGDLKRAGMRVRRLLAIDPEHVGANLALARLLAEQDRPDLAESTLRHVLSRGLQLDALADLAALLEQRGAVDEGMALASRAVSLNPGSPRAQAAYGRLLRRAGRPAEAAAALSTAVGLDPDAVDTRIDLAETLHELGRAEDAKAEIRAIAESGRALADEERRRLRRLLTPGN